MRATADNSSEVVACLFKSSGLEFLNNISKHGVNKKTDDESILFIEGTELE